MRNPPDKPAHEFYMQQCLKLAVEAADAGEVPVGAIVVCDDVVVSQAHNAQISSCDPTAHAEVLALRAASLVLDNYRLPGCTLYSTVEPCLMCAGALLHGEWTVWFMERQSQERERLPGM